MAAANADNAVAALRCEILAPGATDFESCFVDADCENV
jgi:hypothetical protein